MKGFYNNSDSFSINHYADVSNKSCEFFTCKVLQAGKKPTFNLLFVSYRIVQDLSYHIP